MNNPRVIALTAAFVMASASAEAFDESKYPDLKGQWERVGRWIWGSAQSGPPTASPRRSHYLSGQLGITHRGPRMMKDQRRNVLLDGDPPPAGD
jgi:hypothetical protein